MDVLTIEHLTKKIGNKTILEDVSFKLNLALEDKGLANTHFKRAIELFESVGEFEGIKEIEELINR